MRYIETIKIVDGKPCNLSYHLDRMMDTVGVLFPLVLATELHGIVKCRIVYDQAQIHEISYSSYDLPTIKRLKIVESPTTNYRLKAEDRSEMNALYAMRGAADDVLITQNGKITDTSFCNVVFENADGLFTPRTTLLNGTKRRKLLSEGIISEREISLSDLSQYHTIHLVNAMIELEDGVSVLIEKVMC